MARSYKIYKSYHTSHHNTTKIHPKNSTLLNFYASSNTPTLTTLPPNHKQSQPFLPAIQRSADGSSNSRQTTLPTTLKDQPGRCVRSVTGSAGGELILGWWKSALFFKSPLSERQQAASSDFLKTLLADFQCPRSQPPTKPQTSQHPLPRRPFIRSFVRSSTYKYKKRHHVTKNAVPLSYSSYCEKSIKQKPDQPSQPQQSPASS